MAVHASHAALPYPIRNARYTVDVIYLDADGDPTDPVTPVTEISKDNGNFADCTEEIAVPSTNRGGGMITFTGAETDCSTAKVWFGVASGPKATMMTLQPRALPIVSSGTLSAGSAGGGTLGTILARDITGCFIRTTGGTGGGGSGGANNQARRIVSYNTSTGAFTVSPNWETTPSTDTTYDILLPEGVTLGMLGALNPTTAGRTLDVSATGEAGLDWANVGSPTTTVGLSGTTVKTATDVATDTAAIKTKTDNLPTDPADQSLIITATDAVMTRLGAPAGASIAADIATRATPAQVNTECDAALADVNLDHLVGTATGIPAVPPGTFLDQIMDDGTQTFDRTTDSLQAIRDRGDSAWGGSGGETRLREGTAQAGAAGTIMLDAGASAVNDFYKHCVCALTGGTGAGQSQIIASYVGSTKIATMAASWATAPDATTQFRVLPLGTIPGASAPTADAVAEATLDKLATQKMTVNRQTGDIVAYKADLVTPRGTRRITEQDSLIQGLIPQ